MERTDIVIIGAGVVGLAIAAEVGRGGRDVVVTEKHSTFGQGISSRNSEIIHAGIYYPKDSLKAKLCVEGNALLYDFCREHNIPCRQLGKLIVATDEGEVSELEGLLRCGAENGARDLALLSGDETGKLEPNVKALAALHSPSTGIVDTHRLMQRLGFLAEERNVTIAYNCEVAGIEKNEEGYMLRLRDADGESVSLQAGIVINSAGLDANRMAGLVGMDIEKAGYKLHYSKGEYFRVGGSKSGLVSRLIYPTPEEAGLGIHTVTDMQGQLKLGPNAFYVDDINYDVDASHAAEFHNRAKRFLPFIEPEDISADMAGIRPKLQRPGGPKRDFVVCEEGEKGFDGFINLIGIDSPGLTASLPIARYVKTLIR